MTTPRSTALLGSLLVAVGCAEPATPTPTDAAIDHVEPADMPVPLPDEPHLDEAPSLPDVHDVATAMDAPEVTRDDVGRDDITDAGGAADVRDVMDATDVADVSDVTDVAVDRATVDASDGGRRRTIDFEWARDFPTRVTAGTTGVGDWGDVNGDGRPDRVIVWETQNTLEVMLADGRGGYATGATFMTTTPRAAALADLNGDGRLDLVVQHGSATTRVTTAFGRGDGTFGAEVPSPTGVDFVPGILPLRDVSGDGVPDLVSFTSGNFRVFAGQRDGTFAPYATATTTGTSSPVWGDVNGDGRFDLITRAPGGLAVLLARAGGGFDASRSVPASMTSLKLLGAADFDGDGRDDVVGAYPLILNLFQADGSARPVTVATGALSSEYGRVDDFNDDGLPDVALGTNDGAFTVMRGDGRGGLRPLGLWWVGAPVLNFRAVDSDGDRRSELWIDYVSPRLIARAGADDLAAPIVARLASGPAGPHALADFNRDGRTDAVELSVTPASLTWLEGAGDGSVRDRGTAALAFTPEQVFTGDIDGDGRPDAIVTEARNRNVYAVRATGDFTFAAPQRTPDVRPLAVADLDGDGADDLVGYVTPGLGVAFADGRGGFTTPTALQSGATGVAVGDVDGDGRVDLVVLDQSTGQLTRWRNEGSRAFWSAAVGALEPADWQMTLADFNGDRRLDLAAITLDTTPQVMRGVLVALTQQPDGSLRPALRTEPLYDYGLGVIARDLDRDGALDLLGWMRNGRVAVVQGFGDGTFGSVQRFDQGIQARVSLADMDGDGLADMVTSATVNGTSRGLMVRRNRSR